MNREISINNKRFYLTETVNARGIRRDVLTMEDSLGKCEMFRMEPGAWIEVKSVAYPNGVRRENIVLHYTEDDRPLTRFFDTI